MYSNKINKVISIATVLVFLLTNFASAAPGSSLRVPLAGNEQLLKALNKEVHPDGKVQKGSPLDLLEFLARNRYFNGKEISFANIRKWRKNLDRGGSSYSDSVLYQEINSLIEMGLVRRTRTGYYTLTRKVTDGQIKKIQTDSIKIVNRKGRNGEDLGIDRYTLTDLSRAQKTYLSELVDKICGVADEITETAPQREIASDEVDADVAQSVYVKAKEYEAGKFFIEKKKFYDRVVDQFSQFLDTGGWQIKPALEITSVKVQIISHQDMENLNAGEANIVTHLDESGTLYIVVDENYAERVRSSVPDKRNDASVVAENLLSRVMCAAYQQSLALERVRFNANTPSDAEIQTVAQAVLKWFGPTATREDEKKLEEWLSKKGEEAVHEFVALIVADRGGEKIGPYVLPKIAEDTYKMNEVAENSAVGEKQYPMPYQKEQYDQERVNLMAHVAIQKALGRQVVLNIGIGHVGTGVMAVNSQAKEFMTPKARGSFLRSPLSGSQYCYDVIGYERPFSYCYYKVEVVKEGGVPIKTADPTAPIVMQEAHQRGNMTATFLPESIGIADVIMVETELHVRKLVPWHLEQNFATPEATLGLLKKVGSLMHKDALVVVESTVYPGFTSLEAEPVLSKALRDRKLIGENESANLSYMSQRMRPGEEWLKSLMELERVGAAVNEDARELLRDYVKKVGFKYQIWDDVTASEFVKDIENAWTFGLFELMGSFMKASEKIGIDIFAVVKEIVSARPETHAEMMRMPTIKVAGYCVPKELCQLLYGLRTHFGLSPLEIMDMFGSRLYSGAVSDHRAEDVVWDLMEDFGAEDISMDEALLIWFGAAYKEGNEDARMGGTEQANRLCAHYGADSKVTDPFAKYWKEMDQQDLNNPECFGWGLENQQQLKDLRIHHTENPYEIMDPKGDALIFSTRHWQYVSKNQPKKMRTQPLAGGKTKVHEGVDPIKVAAQMMAQEGKLLFDTYNFFNDKDYKIFLALGFRIRASGKGHIYRGDKPLIGQITDQDRLQQSKRLLKELKRMKASNEGNADELDTAIQVVQARIAYLEVEGTTKAKRTERNNLEIAHQKALAEQKLKFYAKTSQRKILEAKIKLYNTMLTDKNNASLLQEQSATLEKLQKENKNLVLSKFQKDVLEVARKRTINGLEKASNLAAILAKELDREFVYPTNIERAVRITKLLEYFRNRNLSTFLNDMDRMAQEMLTDKGLQETAQELRKREEAQRDAEGRDLTISDKYVDPSDLDPIFDFPEGCKGELLVSTVFSQGEDGKIYKHQDPKGHTYRYTTKWDKDQKGPKNKLPKQWSKHTMEVPLNLVKVKEGSLDFELYPEFMDLPFELRKWLVEDVWGKGYILSTMDGEKQDKIGFLMDVNLDPKTAARGRGGVLFWKDSRKPVIATNTEGKEYILDIKSFGDYKGGDPRKLKTAYNRPVRGGKAKKGGKVDVTVMGQTPGHMKSADDVNHMNRLRLEPEYSSGKTPRSGFRIRWIYDVVEFTEIEFEGDEAEGIEPLDVNKLIKAIEKKIGSRLPKGITPIESLNKLLQNPELYKHMPKKLDDEKSKSVIDRLGHGIEVKLSEIIELNRNLIEINFEDLTPRHQDNEFQGVGRQSPDTMREGHIFPGDEEEFDVQKIAGVRGKNSATILAHYRSCVHIAVNSDNILRTGYYTDNGSNIDLFKERDPYGCFYKYFGYYMQLCMYNYLEVDSRDFTNPATDTLQSWLNAFIERFLAAENGKMIKNKDRFKEEYFKHAQDVIKYLQETRNNHGERLSIKFLSKELRLPLKDFRDKKLEQILLANDIIKDATVSKDKGEVHVVFDSTIKNLDDLLRRLGKLKLDDYLRDRTVAMFRRVNFGLHREDIDILIKKGIFMQDENDSNMLYFDMSIKDDDGLRNRLSLANIDEGIIDDIFSLGIWNKSPEQFNEEMLNEIWQHWLPYQILKNRLEFGYDPTMESTYTGGSAEYQFDANSEEKAREFIKDQRELLTIAKRLIDEEGYEKLFHAGKEFDFGKAFKELENKEKAIDELRQQEGILKKYATIYDLDFYPVLKDEPIAILDTAAVFADEPVMRLIMKRERPKTFIDKYDAGAKVRLRVQGLRVKKLFDSGKNAMTSGDIKGSFGIPAIPMYFLAWKERHSAAPEIYETEKAGDVYALMFDDVIATKQHDPLAAYPDLKFGKNKITKDYLEFTYYVGGWWYKVQVNQKTRDTKLVVRSKDKKDVEIQGSPLELFKMLIRLYQQGITEITRKDLMKFKGVLRDDFSEGTIDLEIASLKLAGIIDNVRGIIRLSEPYRNMNLHDADRLSEAVSKIEGIKNGLARWTLTDKKEQETKIQGALKGISKNIKLGRLQMMYQRGQEETEEKEDAAEAINQYINAWANLDPEYPGIFAIDTPEELFNMMKADFEAVPHQTQNMYPGFSWGEVEETTEDYFVFTYRYNNLTHIVFLDKVYRELKQMEIVFDDSSQIEMQIGAFLEQLGRKESAYRHKARLEQFKIEGTKGEMQIHFKKAISGQLKTVVIDVHGLGGSAAMNMIEEDYFGPDAATVVYTESRYKPMPPYGERGPNTFDEVWGNAGTPEAKTMEDAIEDLRRVIRGVLDFYKTQGISPADVEIFLNGRSHGAQIISQVAGEFSQIKGVNLVVYSMEDFSGSGIPKSQRHPIVRTPTERTVGNRYTQYENATQVILGTKDMPERMTSSHNLRKYKNPKGTLNFHYIEDGHGMRKPDSRKKIKFLTRKFIETERNRIKLLKEAQEKVYSAAIVKQIKQAMTEGETQKTKKAIEEFMESILTDRALLDNYLIPKVIDYLLMLVDATETFQTGATPEYLEMRAYFDELLAGIMPVIARRLVEENLDVYLPSVFGLIQAPTRRREALMDSASQLGDYVKDIEAQGALLFRQRATNARDFIAAINEEIRLLDGGKSFGMTGLKLFPTGLGTAFFGINLAKEDGYIEPTQDEVNDHLNEAFTRMASTQEKVMIDTAPAYNTSEVKIGEYFKHHKKERSQAVIATKWGEDYTGESKGRIGYSKEDLIRSVDRSRSNLGPIDLLYFHGTAESEVVLDALRDEDLMDEMKRMRDTQHAGIRYLGASITREETLAQALKEGLLDDFDVIQIAIGTVLSKEGVKLIDRLHEKGIAVVVNSPVRWGKRLQPQKSEEEIFTDLLKDARVSMVLTGTRRHLDETVGYTKKARLASTDDYGDEGTFTRKSRDRLYGLKHVEVEDEAAIDVPDLDAGLLNREGASYYFFDGKTLRYYVAGKDKGGERVILEDEKGRKVLGYKYPDGETIAGDPDLKATYPGDQYHTDALSVKLFLEQNKVTEPCYIVTHIPGSPAVEKKSGTPGTPLVTKDSVSFVINGKQTHATRLAGMPILTFGLIEKNPYIAFAKMAHERAAFEAKEEGKDGNAQHRAGLEAELSVLESFDEIYTGSYTDKLKITPEIDRAKDAIKKQIARKSYGVEGNDYSDLEIAQDFSTLKKAVEVMIDEDRFGDAYEITDDFINAGLGDEIATAEVLRTQIMEDVIVVAAASITNVPNFKKFVHEAVTVQKKAVVVIAMDEAEYTSVKDIEGINIKVKTGAWTSKYALEENQKIKLNNRQKLLIEVYEMRGVNLDVLDSRLNRKTTRSIVSGV